MENDLKSIQKLIDNVMNEQNNRAISKFEGYSAFEMHQILHFTFGTDSPIELQELSDADYKKIPLLNQIKYLTDLIHKSGELKLTNKGYLPTKIVADLYQQGYMKDSHFESGISKLYKETDSMTINLTRMLIELSGIVKKRNGKLSLTKTGEKVILDDFKLLKTIIENFASKFNWAYFDGYGENQIGQLGYGFSLILLSKYGHEILLDSFYAEKYFNAYPRLLETIEPRYNTREKYSFQCYSLRFFDRFMDYFGLINIEEEGKMFNSLKYISKTELFDKLIKVRAHKL